MALPKTYIYGFDNTKVLVCSYSIELFNNLMKHVRSNSLVYVGDLVTVSHSIFNRSSCNCRQIIKDSIDRLDMHQLQVMERVVLPLEIVELDQATSHLFVCEICRVRKNNSESKLKILNTSSKSRHGEGCATRDVTRRPRHCLLRLCKILDEDIWLRNSIVGRNNSFNGKSEIYKGCCKDIARELVGKGALPGDLSQKCLYSPDNNRCWFDYCRLMDICIRHKLSAREIADFIKHLAGIDPMKPDPVVCIKNKFESKKPHQKNHKRKSNHHDSESSSSPQTESSPTKSDSSSSSLSDLMVSNTAAARKSKNHLGKCKSEYSNNDDRHRASKKTQTLNSGSQSEIWHCKCCKSTPHRTPNDLETDNYLWSPDQYEKGNYLDNNEPMNDQYYPMDANFCDERRTRYSNFPSRECDSDGDVHRRNTMSRDDGRGYANGFHLSTNHRNPDGYDSELYEDFMRQNQLADEEDMFLPDGYDDADEMAFYNEDENGRNSFSGFQYPQQFSGHVVQSDRTNGMKKSLILQPSQVSINNPARIRSSSQPVYPSKCKIYKLVSNTNNSLDSVHEPSDVTANVKLSMKCDNVTDSFTQTNKSPPKSLGQEKKEMKKCPSDSILCVKTSFDEGNNNNPRQPPNARDHHPVFQDLLSKTFKGEAVQTDSLPLDMSRCQATSLRSSSQQTKFPDSSIPIQSEDSGKRRETPNENANCERKRSTRSHMKGVQKLSKVWVNKCKPRLNESSYSYSINRNANNHSLSRSASSRNSQVVEIENDGNEKISSVLVESDIRSVLLFREASSDYLMGCNFNNVTKSPFFEMSSTHSIPAHCRYNMNTNNVIKSVTVTNQVSENTPSPGVALYKCMVFGCRNLVEGLNYYCGHHSQLLSRQISPQPSPQLSPQSCSPERCLSRLSCIVGLNRQILENQEIAQESSLQMNALHKAIYGPYNDDDCARVLALTSNRSRLNEVLPVKSEYLNNDSQYLLSLSDPNRRFCSRLDCPNMINSNRFSEQVSYPQYSATKLEKQNLCECLELKSRVIVLEDLLDMHKPASQSYQSQFVELASPLAPYAISDCRNAAFSDCAFHNQHVSANKTPLNGTYRLSHSNYVSQCGLDIPKAPESFSLGYETIKDNMEYGSTPSREANQSRIYQLSETRINSSKQDPRQQTPCGRRIPVPLQLCPIPGCTNLTITKGPPCMDPRFVAKNTDWPDSIYKKPYVNSPFIDVEYTTEGRTTERSPLKRTADGISYGQSGLSYINSSRNISDSAKCEVILDDEMVSTNRVKELPTSIPKTLSTNSFTSHLRTVTADSEKFRQREGSASHDVTETSQKINEETRDPSVTQVPIKHVSNHQTWPELHDTYNPNSIRVSAKTEDNALEHIKPYQENKSVPDVGSNVNHLSEFPDIVNIEAPSSGADFHHKLLPEEMYAMAPLSHLSQSEIDHHLSAIIRENSMKLSNLERHKSRGSESMEANGIDPQFLVSERRKSLVDQTIESHYERESLIDDIPPSRNPLSNRKVSEFKAEIPNLSRSIEASPRWVTENQRSIHNSEILHEQFLSIPKLSKTSSKVQEKLKTLGYHPWNVEELQIAERQTSMNEQMKEPSYNAAMFIDPVMEIDHSQMERFSEETSIEKPKGSESLKSNVLELVKEERYDNSIINQPGLPTNIFEIYSKPLPPHNENFYVNPDHKDELSSKNMVRSSLNESFCPVSIFERPADEESKGNQIILVDPPDSHTKHISSMRTLRPGRTSHRTDSCDTHKHFNKSRSSSQTKSRPDVIEKDMKMKSSNSSSYQKDSLQVKSKDGSLEKDRKRKNDCPRVKSMDGIIEKDSGMKSSLTLLHRIDSPQTKYKDGVIGTNMMMKLSSSSLHQNDSPQAKSRDRVIEKGSNRRSCNSSLPRNDSLQAKLKDEMIEKDNRKKSSNSSLLRIDSPNAKSKDEVIEEDLGKKSSYSSLLGIDSPEAKSKDEVIEKDIRRKLSPSLLYQNEILRAESNDEEPIKKDNKINSPHASIYNKDSPQAKSKDEVIEEDLRKKSSHSSLNQNDILHGEFNDVVIEKNVDGKASYSSLLKNASWESKDRAIEKSYPQLYQSDSPKSKLRDGVIEESIRMKSYYSPLYHNDSPRAELKDGVTENDIRMKSSHSSLEKNDILQEESVDEVIERDMAMKASHTSLHRNDSLQAESPDGQIERSIRMKSSYSPLYENDSPEAKSKDGVTEKDIGIKVTYSSLDKNGSLQAKSTDRVIDKEIIMKSSNSSLEENESPQLKSKDKVIEKNRKRNSSYVSLYENEFPDGKSKDEVIEDIKMKSSYSPLYEMDPPEAKSRDKVIENHMGRQSSFSPLYEIDILQAESNDGLIKKDSKRISSHSSLYQSKFPQRKSKDILKKSSYSSLFQDEFPQTDKDVVIEKDMGIKSSYSLSHDNDMKNCVSLNDSSFPLAPTKIGEWQSGGEYPGIRGNTKTLRNSSSRSSNMKDLMLASNVIDSPIEDIKGDVDSHSQEVLNQLYDKYSNKKQWRNISVFNQHFHPHPDAAPERLSPCPPNVDMYSYVLEIDINKTFGGPAAPMLTCKLGDFINNSANIKLISTKDNRILTYDEILPDGMLQNSSRVDPNMLVHDNGDSHATCLNSHISYSTPDLVMNDNSKVVIVPEKFQLDSDIAIEYKENSSDSLALVIDQSTETLYFLTTAYVTIQTCNHTTPLLTVNQRLSKSKRSKIRKLFQSMRTTKSQRQQFYCVQQEKKPDKSAKFLKTIFMLELKSKMLGFIRRRKSNRPNVSDKSQITPSTLDTMPETTESSSYFTDHFLYRQSNGDQSSCQLNLSKCNLWTRSCCDLHLRNKSKSKDFCFRRIRIRSLSEPTIENSYKTLFPSNHLYRSSSMTFSEIPTSGLSILCFEVLEKMERKLGKNPRLIEELTAKRFMKAIDFWSQSSKDTLKLIGRALQYLHGNRFDDSRQSNKTLDSVSSIRTCSADCIESISSLRQKIIRPLVSSDNTVSAYNRRLPK